jgi:tRNA (guanine-N7-)-methyltransferase
LEAENPRPRRKGAGSFFGRRHGKTLRPLHASLLEYLLPELRLDLEALCPSTVSELFGASVDAIRLEIGFGGGEHLLHRMRENPRTGFIGVEPFVNGMAKLLAVLHTEPMGNIRLFDQDAALLLDWLPAASLRHVDILYPDPWPKKRQHKRRFISPENLVRLARCIKPGGILCFASDIAEYVNWTLIHVRAHGGFAFDAADADSWRLPYPGWPGTRYEAKAFREGRIPAYLTFTRNS